MLCLGKDLEFGEHSEISNTIHESRLKIVQWTWGRDYVIILSVTCKSSNIKVSMIYEEVLDHFTKHWFSKCQGGKKLGNRDCTNTMTTLVRATDLKPYVFTHLYLYEHNNKQINKGRLLSMWSLWQICVADKVETCFKINVKLTGSIMHQWHLNRLC